MMKPAPDSSEASSSPANSTPRVIVGEFLRFLVMGGANTLVAYAIYLLLLNWMRYEFAYAIGYGVGIVLAYALSTVFVFRKPMNTRSALRFPLVYLVQFLFSFVLLYLAVEVVNIPEWLAFGFAVIITIPFTFAVSRWVLHTT